MKITEGQPGKHGPSDYKYVGPHKNGLHVFDDGTGKKELFAKRKPGSGDGGWHLKRGGHVYEFASSLKEETDMENENVELDDFEVFLQMCNDEEVTEEELDQAFAELDEETQDYIHYLMEDEGEVEPEVEEGPVVSDLVAHAANQSALDFQKTFDDLMAQRLESAVAEKKLELAQELFMGKVEEPEAEVEGEDEQEGEIEEETEQLDEIKKPLGSYVKKASRNAVDYAWDSGFEIASGKEGSSERSEKQFQKRLKGIERATDRLTGKKKFK